MSKGDRPMGHVGDDRTCEDRHPAKLCQPNCDLERQANAAKAKGDQADVEKAVAAAVEARDRDWAAELGKVDRAGVAGQARESTTKLAALNGKPSATVQQRPSLAVTSTAKSAPEPRTSRRPAMG